MGEVPNFRDGTTVKQESSHTYSADFRDEWCIGTVPHGGYVTSVFMRVADLHFETTLHKQNQPHTIALHLDFLRRTEKGPALFTVKDAKLGRQASVIHVTLSQTINGSYREEVVGYITRSNMHTESGETFASDWRLHPAPYPAEPRKFDPDTDGNWTIQRVAPFTKFRKASTRVDWILPRQRQLSPRIADVWLRLNTKTSDGRREKFTDASLGYISDMWPQLIEQHFDIDAYNPTRAPQETGSSPMAKFWYPTLILNLDVKKALPAEGVDYLFVRVQTKQIKNGRYDLEICILDEGGDLVALSHHVCFALPAARNTAKRRRQGPSEKL